MNLMEILMYFFLFEIFIHKNFSLKWHVPYLENKLD